MAVEFILGRTASRRDEEAYGRIAQAVAADPLAPVFVIVPPQATFATECALLEYLHAPGLMGVNVASISRIAQRVLDEVHGTGSPAVGAAARSMAARQAMDDCAGQLQTLARMGKHHELPPLIADAVTECKRLAITPDMLLEFDAGNEAANRKFHDLALLYRRMDELLAGGMDTEDRLAFATQHIGGANFIRKAQVFVLGFDMFNALTVAFIQAVMRTAKHTTMSFLYADANDADSPLYGICDENRMQFFETARECGLTVTKVAADGNHAADILHIEKNLFAHPAKRAKSAGGLSISKAASVRAEIDGVAAQVAWLTQKTGVRYSEIAIVCADAEAYLPLLRERFALSAIPCSTGEKRPLRQSAIADFVLGAFRLMAGRLNKDDLLAHAATGYCDLTRAECAVLQNYAYAHIRDGFAFLREFADDTAEAARRKLMGPIGTLRGCAKAGLDARGRVACVLDYLEELDVRGKVEREAEALRAAGNFEDADFAEQAYERMLGVLGQAAGVFAGNIAALGRVLEAGIAAEEIAVIPPAAEEVRCGDISGTYIPAVRVLFVLGANEGALPDYSPRTDVLTDAERTLLLGGLKGLQHTGVMDKQRLAIVKAFARPSEKLYISYVDDGVRQPSILVDTLLRILDGVRQNDLADIAPLLRRNAYELAARAVGGVDDCPAETVAAVLEDADCAAGLERIEHGLADGNSARRVAEHAAALYGDFKPSATRTEGFYACPYKHFIRYGVRADVPREYAIDVLDAGSYAHDVLDALSRRIRKTGKDWAEFGRDEYAALVRDCAAGARGKQEKYGLNKHNATVLDAVQRDVELAAEMIRRQCIKDELRPEQTELRYDLQTANAQVVIDRLDTATVDGQPYFAVVDYKSGNRDFDLARMAAGLDLQLLLYVMAVRELLGEEYAFAGANYMRIYSALRERDEALEPLYRMRGIEGAAGDVAARLFGQDERGGLFSVQAGRNKDGSYDYHAKKRHYTPEEMDVLVAAAAKLLQDAERWIKNGVTDIRPALDKNGLACMYCEFGSVCRFDTASAAGARPIPTADRETLLEEMRKRCTGAVEDK